MEEKNNNINNGYVSYMQLGKSSGFDVIRNIIDSHEDASVFCDVDFVIRYYNSACISLVGGNINLLLGNNLFDSFPDFIFKQNVDLIVDAQKNGEMCKFDCKIEHADGVFDKYRVEGGLFSDGMFFKIHKEQQIESLSQANFKMLFESMTSGFMYIKPVVGLNGNISDHIVLDVNSAFEILFGLEREQIIGKSIKLIDKDFDVVWIKRFGRTAMTGHSFSGKFYHHLYGKYYEFKSYSPAKGYTAVIINDMQAQLEARNELMVKSEISKAFALGTSISLYKIILDLLLKHTKSDKGFLGYIDESLQKLCCPAVCGNISGDVVPKNMINDFAAILDIKSNPILNVCITQLQAVEYQDCDMCGEFAKYSIILPVINDDKPVGIIAISNTIGNYTSKEKNFIISLANYIASLMAAEIKERNYKLQIVAEKERAERNERLKTAFLGNISHEIRSPLNVILGFCDVLLKSNNLTQKQIKYINVIFNSGRQLLEIVESMIDLSKIQTMQVRVIEDVMDLNKTLSEVMDKGLRWSEEKNLSLTCVKGLDDGQSKIIGDKYKISKIVYMLVNNAIKFTNKGGVEFGYKVENDKLKFFVHDTGIGIHKEQYKDIFKSFQQLEKVLTRQYRGVGIGLTICKGFLDVMGGSIWLESELNKGSTFYFTIDYKPVNK